MSALGFGGADVGYEAATQADVDRMTNAALDSALNVADAAECCIDSEAKIGKAISPRREGFPLLTKCGHSSVFSQRIGPPEDCRTERSLTTLKQPH